MSPSEIKAFRKAKGLTQEELGKLCGVGKSSVSQWESGSTAPSGPAKAILDDYARGERMLLPLTPLEERLLDELLRRSGLNSREELLSKLVVEAIGKDPLTPAPKLTPFQPPPSKASEDPGTYAGESLERFELPFLGAVAAGEPVEAPLNESLPVPRKFPAGHFVVEVNGRSAEPEYPDGSRWVVDGRDKYTPKDGAVCVVSDGSGSYLKRWNRKRKVFESVNPEFNDLIPAEEAKLQGYPVEPYKEP